MEEDVRWMGRSRLASKGRRPHGVPMLSVQTTSMRADADQIPAAVDPLHAVCVFWGRLARLIVLARLITNPSGAFQIRGEGNDCLAE